MRKTFACIPLFVWFIMGASAILLYLVPQIDIAVSDLFYTPGQGFLQRGTTWERLLYKSVPIVLMFVGIGGLVLWLYNRIRGAELLQWSGRKLLYLLLAGSLGSGLIVNAILKDHWGRARPVNTIPFGGSKQFTPPFVLSDQGGKSFSSGHTSGAFALLPLLFLAKRRRRWIGTVVIAYGLAVSAARIAAGGHFFSDVIVSIFILYVVSAALHCYLFGRAKAADAV